MTTRTLRRILLPALVVLALAAGVGGARETAAAADLRGFDPGVIISDSVFYDATAMSGAQVQQFLAVKGAGCVPAGGNTCLKDFRETTATRAADTRCTGSYTGAANEGAAQIIAKVAVACGINPQVLLVTLQKEQGLVTASAGKSAAVYRKAMGYGCPDTAPCDALYYGFFNQVYNAAHQFQNYAARPTSYAHRAGAVNQVRYHPNAACGSSAVYIQNQATASLYNYTPYQPNAAALAAGYGTGDSCSSYGNRNFWNYFTDWFGSSTQRMPFGALDAVTSPTTGQIEITGWALDPDTTAPIPVHVYVDGQAVKSVVADASRPDVGAAHGKGNAHGFRTSVTAGGGPHQVCVWAIDSTGGVNPQIGCASVTVANRAPIGSLDALSSVEGKLRVQGWVLDPDTTDSIAAHVYVDGVIKTAVVANRSRPDVAAAYGKGAAHGFSVDVPVPAGVHEICLFAIDPLSGPHPRIGCQNATVVNQAPIGSLDGSATGDGQFTARGWVLDPDTAGPIRAHLYLDGAFVTSVVADAARPDVAAVHGTTGAHGFSATVQASVGEHQLCLFAIDSWGGNNPKIGCKTVVANGRPFGTLDLVQSPEPGQVQVAGWAIDPNTTAPVQVHVYLDGVAVRSLTANAPRADVDAAHGMGPLHGYDTTLTGIASGSHTVCTYALDTFGPSQGGINPQLGCRPVTVP